MESHPWREISLEVYEAHMSDEAVGQLDRLSEITAEQLQDHPSRSIGILGVAGGNGLDLIDPDTVDCVRGYDVNPDYLAACRLRYTDRFGARLMLIECSIDRALVIDPTELVIANLIIEYVGVTEFVAFAQSNAERIGVLSCVTQQNHGVGLVSATGYSAAFAGLESIASEVDPDVLASAMTAARFALVATMEYPLPNGKVLTRQDFRPVPV
ncbi:hypothetical protein J2X85_001426 [Microbacterium trichothecenolyticum]|uniref:hypothetical protein n=1 Tax=Microbacterium trichothecenolyticum TaxID=69370 RepID=UPI00285ACE31|nr:hypothetical protein [Microbacterium trichothecenolyticum]MDR7184403.1 hypothetical protein [Microbacterium trichothecenolyticum]